MPKTYIINTNKSNDSNCELEMVKNEKCAAYFAPYKFYIDEIETDDIVFLYSNGKGIIARGTATGIPVITDHEGKADEEHYMKLNSFLVLEKPLPRSEITRIVGHEIYIAQTRIPLTYNNGTDLWQEITKNYI